MEERAARDALADAIIRKRRAIAPPGERRTKNRVLAIAPAFTPETATPNGSFHGSEEEEASDQIEEPTENTMGRSQGFSSILTGESPSPTRGPRNALGGAGGHAGKKAPLPPHTWDWPLSNKERRS